MIRQNRLLGYTWNPEQKKDYEDLYQSWSASDMAAEIVNREILHQSSLAEREQRIAQYETALTEISGLTEQWRRAADSASQAGLETPIGSTTIAAISHCARAALAATEGAQYPRAEKETK